VLERAGYEFQEYLNIVNDVTQPVEIMWSKLQKRLQFAIRKCEKRGYVPREVPPETAIDQLYPLLQLSYRHSGVPLADSSLFDAGVRELAADGRAKFFGVYNGDRALAMDAILAFKDRIYLWYGGVTRDCDGAPCSLLRWFEMKCAHEHGYAISDSGGAGWPHIPYGVRDFKRKFGGEVVQYGRYRKVFSPFKLALAERVYKLRRAIVSQK
jgi:serine/alanine adding enzyme